MNAFPRLCLLLLVALPVFAASPADPVPAPGAPGTYRDAALPVDERVADLLARLTLEEKLGQLLWGSGRTAWSRDSSAPVLTDAFKQRFAATQFGLSGGTFRVDAWTRVKREEALRPDQGPAVHNAMQRYAVEHSRLGIPLLFAEDAGHGLMLPGATVFPTAVGVASTWNPELAQRMYRAVANEVRAFGVALTFSPILDVVRDPRWGRVEECYGEDPFLVTRMGVAAVRGFQGGSLAEDRSIAAGIKHFVHALGEGGHNAAYSSMGPRELREVYLEPFRHAVGAGAAAMMEAYTDVDGVPCAMNHALLTDILRGEWGFKGFVIPDAGAIDQLFNRYAVVESFQEAQIAALRAGVDVEGAKDYRENILDAIHRGRLTEADIDRAAARVLRTKFLLGLFERPYLDPALAVARTGSAESRAMAREAAREAIVLLKNEAQTLPLREQLRTIAVIGPNADTVQNQLGDYSAPQWRKDVVTVLDGVKRRAPAGTTVVYAKGCAIRNPSRAGFAEAVAAAEKSDVVVLVLGGSSDRPYRETAVDKATGAGKVEEGSLDDIETGEGFDRMDLGFAGVQAELLAAVKATGKPVVLVLVNGRPLSIPHEIDRVDAVLEAWYGGSEAGSAIADVLFGDANPSGRLPISVARNVGQLPVYYGHRIKERKPYVEMSSLPMFPFGFGLSYTTFAYSNLRLSAAAIRPDGTLQVSVDVQNTGRVAGSDVPQLYLHDVLASVSRPYLQLRGFQKVMLAPGETKTVTFTLTPDDLSLYGAENRWVVEPGEFEVLLGRSCEDIVLRTSFRVAKD